MGGLQIEIALVIICKSINIYLMIPTTSELYFRAAMTTVAFELWGIIDANYSIYYQHQYTHIAFGIIHVVNVSLQFILALYLHTFAHYLLSEINACEFHFHCGIYILNFFPIQELVI